MQVKDEMLMNATINGREFTFEASQPIDISIPLNFNGPQPNAYGVKRATAEACVSGDLVGDTRRGGSCNFERYSLIPHCNGTHTECVGHITNERISVRDCLQDVFIPARLISVTPTGDEPIITRESVESFLPYDGGVAEARDDSLLALIVRTLPNDDGKLTREYNKIIPPYFSADAMQFIVDRGIEHLVVDMPSIDRIYDEGKLANHRIFWNVDAEMFELNENSRRNATVTELIYVPNEVEDGEYMLNLQIAPFASDASPSRPILFSLL
ncbi:MAG TPA: cyclase family protein [Pyrinomonadaceae bacterium]|nr:cyclase family protein [Pyrinomonadaceae bacterium]